MLVRPLFARPAGGGGPPPPPTLNAAFGVGSYPGDGGGYVRIVWSVNNPVGGEYVDIVGLVTAGDPITDIFSGGAPGFYSDPAVTVSPKDFETPLGANAWSTAQVDLYDADDNNIDSITLINQALPT